MVATLFVLTLGLVSLIAVENRFNLVPVAVLSVLAAHFALRKATPAARAAVLMLALCVAVFGAIASHHLQASARVLPALRHGCIETDMN